MFSAVFQDDCSEDLTEYNHNSRAAESQLPLLEDGKILLITTTMYITGKEEPDSWIAIFAICAINARDLK